MVFALAEDVFVGFLHRGRGARGIVESSFSSMRVVDRLSLDQTSMIMDDLNEQDVKACWYRSMGVPREAIHAHNAVVESRRQDEKADAALILLSDLLRDP